MLAKPLQCACCSLVIAFIDATVEELSARACDVADEATKSVRSKLDECVRLSKLRALVAFGRCSSAGLAAAKVLSDVTCVDSVPVAAAVAGNRIVLTGRCCSALKICTLGAALTSRGTRVFVFMTAGCG